MVNLSNKFSHIVKPVHLKIMLPLLSFFILVAVGLFFYGYSNPEVLSARLFNQIQPGILELRIDDNVRVNKPFQIDVVVDSQGQPVNAVGLYIRYQPDDLELLDVDTTESFCQFYPEKKFDNSIGLFSLSCGSPHPGFVGTTTLVSLEFMPIQPTTTNLHVEQRSSILLSNGQASNILETYPQETITILQSL